MMGSAKAALDLKSTIPGNDVTTLLVLRLLRSLVVEFVRQGV